MDIKEVITDDYAIYQNDCMQVLRTLPDASVHLQVGSLPFGSKKGGLFNYTSDPKDLSNNFNYERFLQQYEFIAAECARVAMPGRIKAVHCMDTSSSNTGNGDPLLDFPGDLIEIYTKCRKEDCNASEIERRKGFCGHGWFSYTARRTIWKEPLEIRNRLMLKKLAHKTIITDSEHSGQAEPDYLLIFQRKGRSQIPVTHNNGFMEYYGEDKLPSDVLRYRGFEGDQKKNLFSHQIWRRLASSVWGDIRDDYDIWEGLTDVLTWANIKYDLPVWMDIRFNNILLHKPAKDENDEMHLHPLSLDIIARCIDLFSNPGEIVLDEFLGVGSTVYQAVKMDRIGLGAEIKQSYFNQAVKNLANIKDHKTATEIKNTQLSF